MTPQIQTPVPHEQRGARQNRRTEIARLLRTGKTYAEIVTQVGCGHDLVSAVAKAIAIPVETRREKAKQGMAAKVRALLLAEKTYDEVIAETGATKYLVWNVAREIGCKPPRDTKGVFPSPRLNPTHCSGEPSCNCVWHRAEAVRLEQLAARRKELQRNGVA